jgi:2-deoxy-D-gluconate 3-dehydrogenase
VVADAFRLDDRVALVTGASRGLGAAMAAALAGAGADVVLHASSAPPEAAAADIAARTGRRTHALAGDLRNAAAGDRVVADAIAAFGRVDVVVNNAGTIRRQPAAEHEDAFWDEVLAVNLSSVFRVCRAAGRHMLARGGGGKIVNIASLLSFQGGITVPGYAAAKGGVAQLTKALANEWAAHGINVNAIAPGYMETDNTAALRADAERAQQIGVRIPAGRWGRPEDLAGAVVFLASAASDYVHGHVLVVDGGWMGR